MSKKAIIMSPDTIVMSVYGSSKLNILEEPLWDDPDVSALRAALQRRLCPFTMQSKPCQNTAFHFLQATLWYGTLEDSPDGEGQYIPNAIAEKLASEISDEINDLRDGDLFKLVSLDAQGAMIDPYSFDLGVGFFVTFNP